MAANPALRTHLALIATSERQRTLRWMVWIRMVVVGLYSSAILYHTLWDPIPEAQQTLPVFMGYTLVAGVLAVLGATWPKSLTLVGYTLPTLDVPMLALACWVAIPVVEPERLHSLLNSFLPFNAVLIALSALTLDYKVIGLTTAAAFVSVRVMVHAVGEPDLELDDPSLAMLCVGMVAMLLVSRLLAVVVEFRRRDFGGKYIVGKRIGVGGMAEVFEAVYSPEGSFERRVALKRVLPAWAADPEFMALFRREAELGSLLAHPNLVQVLDFGRHLDGYFLAMEYVEGVSLADLLSTPGRALPIEACLYVMGEVAEALTYLHEKRSRDGALVGLVHRDLNPPNVLISRIGEVKVSDFGVARWQEADSLTRPGLVRGKAGYLPPEVLAGRAPSAAGDLFSLGVMTYELLTRRRLFRGVNDVETGLKVLAGNVPPVSTLVPEVPPVIDQLLQRLLDRDPAQRPSARAVSAVLRTMEGDHYGQGRQALIDVVAGMRVRQSALPPTPSASDDSTKTARFPGRVASEAGR